MCFKYLQLCLVSTVVVKISFYCFVILKIYIFKLKVYPNFFMYLQTAEYKSLYSSFWSERYINECDFVFPVFVHSNPLSRVTCVDACECGGVGGLSASHHEYLNSVSTLKPVDSWFWTPPGLIPGALTDHT